MSKHTPGPWEVYGPSFTDEGPDQGYMAIDIHCPRGGRVALIQAEEKDTLEANARLIAAAPEMFEMLHQLKAYLLLQASAANRREDKYIETEFRNNAAKIGALLDKAEGGEK